MITGKDIVLNVVGCTRYYTSAFICVQKLTELPPRGTHSLIRGSYTYMYCIECYSIPVLLMC